MTQTEIRALVDASDADIIQRSLHDPEQFAVIFDRHAERLHRYAARRVGASVADDLTAETFLAAFAKRRGYDSRYPSAAPWLYGIATKLVSQHRRAEIRQLTLLRLAIPELTAPGHDDQVNTDVAARGLRGTIATALAGLPAGDRDVLVLIGWEQLTYDETARALRIPIGTVRSRLHRARAALRAALDQAGVTQGVKEILGNE